MPKPTRRRRRSQDIEPLPTDPAIRKQALASIRAAQEFAERYNASPHKLAADKLAEQMQRYQPGELTMRHEQLKAELLADALAKQSVKGAGGNRRKPSVFLRAIARELGDANLRSLTRDQQATKIGERLGRTTLNRR